MALLLSCDSSLPPAAAWRATARGTQALDEADLSGQVQQQSLAHRLTLSAPALARWGHSAASAPLTHSGWRAICGSANHGGRLSWSRACSVAGSQAASAAACRLA